jgi:cyclopropane fatty-acyl-phospholipid synthase-like methyltransferase
MNYADSEIKFKKGKLASGIVYPEFFELSASDTVLNIGCGDGVQALVYRGKFKRMVGVDINQSSLETAKKLIDQYELHNFEVINADVEQIPLTEQFDKAIAIDIIEHVINPEKLSAEAFRLLKPGGKLLITFPAMHDKWENLFRFIGRKIFRRRGKTVYKAGWDPDQHQHDYALKRWQGIVSQAGFELQTCRATTLFPPLHYLGVPKFWFTNKYIHALDRFFCGWPVLRNYGQALVCIFEKANL